MMKRIETKLPGVYIIEPQLFGDHRGYFMETYSTRAFEELGITTVFVQDNQSFTAQKGTLRGIHFQNDPMSQAKLVRVTQGAVWDISIDLRKGSPTYKQWIRVELSADNKRMLYIPKGFGHAFITLTDDVQFCYKVDSLYSKEHDRSILYCDPELAIDWGMDNPILSLKDSQAPLLEQSDCTYVYVKN